MDEQITEHMTPEQVAEVLRVQHQVDLKTIQGLRQRNAYLEDALGTSKWFWTMVAHIEPQRFFWELLAVVLVLAVVALWLFWSAVQG